MVIINHKKLCENCFAETDRSPCPVCGFDKNRYVRDQMTLTIGSILESRYVIGGVIGKGGFGTTYLAYDRKLECRVAVKEYYPYGLAVRSPGTTTVSVSNAEAEETFKNGAEKFYDEARLVAKFNGNPNIVSVHDFFYENDTVYFTMGYLEGQTLKAFLKEHGALSPGQAVCVAEAVSNALMAAHSLNVLHRDISPDNIMVCKDGTIKLLDFGAARQVVTEGSQSLSVILKQGFAPLEQYQKKGKQGPWTDIYSLGATLYHALTLDVLDDPMSRLEEDEEYSSNKHHIADELWQVIKKATALKIQDRYQDIFEWKKDLNNLSIKAVPLVEKEISEEKVKFGSTAKALGDTVHIVSGTGTAEEEDAVGVTMPLREEEAVGMTVPLQEEETVGMTMPLQEEDAVGVTVSIQEEELNVSDRAEETAGEAEETGRRNGKKKWAVGLILVAATAIFVFIVFPKKDQEEDIHQEPVTALQTEEASLYVMVNNTYADLSEIYIDDILKNTDVFGNSEIEKTSIESISFINMAGAVPDYVIDDSPDIAARLMAGDIPNYAWDVSKDQDETVMAFVNESDNHLYIVASGKITMESAKGLFGGYQNLKKIYFNNCFDTSQVTDMEYMFFYCRSLRSLDVSGFDTSQVTDMSSMFHGCSSLSSVDVSGFDTSRVTDMSWMFDDCNSLSSVDASGFDTSQVTDMSSIFSGCSSLTSVDVSGFDTSQATDMSWMFYCCSSLSSVDVSGFDMSQVIDMSSMFDGAGITAEEAGLPQ